MSHHTIHITDLIFHYPDGHRALDGVSLHVAPCEKVALVGPNGAGKSTLMLHVNGILSPSSGRVELGGLEVIDANLAQVRAWAGLVFQDPDDQLFSPPSLTTWRSGRCTWGLRPIRCGAAWMKRWRRFTWADSPAGFPTT